MIPNDYTVAVAAMNGRPQRLVTIDHRDGTEFRDHINTDSATARGNFRRRAAAKFSVAVDEFEWLDDAIVAAADEANARADAAADEEDKKERKSQSTQLIELAKNADLFRDPDVEAFARFEVGEHFEVAGVRTKHFRRWLIRLFYLATGKSPSAQAIQDAIGVLDGQAVYAGPTRAIHLRVASHEDKIYVDLCNDAWQVVEVSASGWRLVDESPVMFRRVKAMLPLPVPTSGGNVHELRRFVHMADDDWVLFLAWLVASLQPFGPYPVLDMQGEHGCGKSTTCRMARALVDPNTAMLRSEPREPRDLMIASKNGWVIALDNLSGIPTWQSDCLCRLSTGGGFSTRTLYENDEETIFSAQRPVIINGIDDVATRADLLDRCLLLNLPRIDPTQRKPESALWRDFEEARPRILGAVLSAVAAALRDIQSIKLSTLPRMADFAIWATAAEAGLNLVPGQFMAAYEANRAAGNAVAIDASPVGKQILDLVSEVGSWAGTPTQLLQELEARVDERTKRLKTWPSGSRAFGGLVKRIAPNLRDAGIGVEFGRSGRGRKITLKRMDADSNVTNVTNDTGPEKQVIPSDDEVTFSGRSDVNDTLNDTSEPPANPGKNYDCDDGDEGDAKIPTQSYLPEWTEV